MNTLVEHGGGQTWGTYHYAISDGESKGRQEILHGIDSDKDWCRLQTLKDSSGLIACWAIVDKTQPKLIPGDDIVDGLQHEHEGNEAH
jgi:hypothetical protein